MSAPRETASTTLRLSRLARSQPVAIAIQPDRDALDALAERLDLLGLRKVRLTGELTPEGDTGWTLDARLGATVVQPCVATLAPVTTRIEETLERRYRADLAPPPDGGEVEMPEDDSIEPLPETLDLQAVLEEALALALPPYPRADGAEAGDAQFTEPGKTPMTDDDARPFAGLKALRDRLEDE